jgi:hypothetical protein
MGFEVVRYDGGVMVIQETTTYGKKHVLCQISTAFDATAKRCRMIDKAMRKLAKKLNDAGAENQTVVSNDDSMIVKSKTKPEPYDIHEWLYVPSESAWVRRKAPGEKSDIVEPGK